MLFEANRRIKHKTDFEPLLIFLPDEKGRQMMSIYRPQEHETSEADEAET